MSHYPGESQPLLPQYSEALLVNQQPANVITLPYGQRIVSSQPQPQIVVIERPVLYQQPVIVRHINRYDDDCDCCCACAITTYTPKLQIPLNYDNGALSKIYFNATVYTVDKMNPVVDSFGVKDGKFFSVGKFRDAEELFKGVNVEFINLNQKTVIPGLTDSHGHLMNLGRMLSNAQLQATRSIQEIRETLLEFVAKNPLKSNEWLIGRGWDQNKWNEASFPTFKDLEHPILSKFHILLTRVDGHAVWVNKKVLDFAKIPAEDPLGGSIVRFSNGLPTGVFIDNAQNLVTSLEPEASEEKLNKILDLAIKEMLSKGLVGVHDAGVTKQELKLYQKAIDENRFPIRNYAMFSSENLVDKNLKKIKNYKNKLVMTSVKVYADGALGSYGSAMDKPYSDDPSKIGFLLSDEKEFYNIVKEYVKLGFQVNTHCIGDRGNRVILDAYEKVIKDLNVTDNSDLRLRIEHAQIVSLSDIKRFGKLKIIPSMQPTHATSDMYFAEKRIGKERIKGAYAWKSMLNAGVSALPLGSDFPVEAVNPFFGFYAAVSRKDNSGNWPRKENVNEISKENGGWYPNEKLTRMETLRGFTIDAAYASFREDVMGSIEEGKFADFIVLDRDIMKVEEIDILGTKVLNVFIDGKKEF
ncbi:hypothetical protein HK099_001665 [Clydaea vesicula]|uniref:Amidohydrolase 3 domain-containing protein n=1 Tax=Clydaea vesicula TaxID=447962 RepID=A0AAD5Y1N7_9FUNG|nr:hypothetical protein HK099_001665 [Clydaea vesicula]KAJ3394626.1 hypothetical protein HDU92_006731 [Lobulomyces angularis]